MKDNPLLLIASDLTYILINFVIKELCNVHITAFSKATKQTIIASILGGLLPSLALLASY